jgi:hypothetical protein
MIDWWQEEMYNAQAWDWANITTWWIHMANISLYGISSKPHNFEHYGSELYPRPFKRISLLNKEDTKIFENLVSSTQILSITSPKLRTMIRASNPLDPECAQSLQYTPIHLLVPCWMEQKSDNVGITRHTSLPEALCEKIVGYTGYINVLCRMEINFDWKKLNGGTKKVTSTSGPTVATDGTRPSPQQLNPEALKITNTSRIG